MIQKFIPLLLVLPLIVSASIVEDNSGLDRSSVGNWSFFTGAATNVTVSTRDNITANGDTWLAQNAGHFVKSPFGATDGITGDEGFAGIYKGAGGDTIYMLYTFTAASAIAEQEWIAKGTVWRNNLANSGRLHFAVNPRGEGFTVLAATGWFGRSSDGADIDIGATATGTALNGPTASYTTDLSSLNIQSGDSVVYRFALNPNDALSGTTGRQVGIGVQLVPEPNTVLMGLGGSFLLYILYRRKK